MPATIQAYHDELVELGRCPVSLHWCLRRSLYLHGVRRFGVRHLDSDSRLDDRLSQCPVRNRCGFAPVLLAKQETQDFSWV